MRARHWDQQKQAGIDLLPGGRFCHVQSCTDHQFVLGNVPPRHQNKDSLGGSRHPVPYWSWTCADWRTCGGSGNDQMV
ncbi:hypothetical protein ACLK1T_11575 [Escherichia coli]